MPEAAYHSKDLICELGEDGILHVQRKINGMTVFEHILPESLFPVFTESKGIRQPLFPSVIAVLLLTIILWTTRYLYEANRGVLIFALISTICCIAFLWQERKKAEPPMFIFDASIGRNFFLTFRKSERKKAFQFAVELSKICLKRFHYPPIRNENVELLLDDLYNDRALTEEEYTELKKLFCPGSVPGNRIGFLEGTK